MRDSEAAVMLRSQKDRCRLSTALRQQGGVSKPVSGLTVAHGAVDTKSLLAKKQQQQRRGQARSAETNWAVLSMEIVKKCSKQDQQKVCIAATVVLV